MHYKKNLLMIGLLIYMVKARFFKRRRGLQLIYHDTIRSTLSILGKGIYLPVMTSRAKIVAFDFLNVYLRKLRSLKLLEAKSKKSVYCIIKFQ